MAEKIIKKIITREKFEKALSSRNYKEVSEQAQSVINEVGQLDLLELDTTFGSALKVISAKKLDENRYFELLKNC